MAEFDNNNADQNASNENNVNQNNNQNQNNKAPEYSFWAEQVPNNNYSSYNPNLNNQYQNNPNQYGNYQNNPYQNYTNQNNPNFNNAYQSNANQNNAYQNNAYQNNAYLNYANQEVKKKEKKPVNKVVKFAAIAVCFGLIAGLSFFGVQQIYYAINPNAAANALMNNRGNQEDTSYEIGYTDSGTIKTADRSLISDVTSNTIPSIVSINCISTATTEWFGQSIDQEVEGSGSGIIVGEDEKELLIATNNHVVEGASKITVTFADGTEAEAIIKGTDSTADLAVVTVDIFTLTEDTKNAITVAKLGSSDDIKVGEMVVAIGNALGYGQSVTVGYVSAKDREVEVSDGFNAKTMVLLQTDAAINPGNSGGALINTDGEVIGINTVKYASSEVEGMGYAIPITKATPIINDLMTREVLTEAEKGYLGIAGNDVTEEVASFYNMPIGVFIEEVSKGGSAEKAGLKAEDIITGADDLEISSISQLKEYVNSLRVGTEVKITYMRNTNGQYEEATVTVTLGQNPNLTTTE